MNDIIHFSLQDHSVKTYVPFGAQTPMIVSYPHVQSQLFYAANPSVNPQALNPTTNSANSVGDPNFPRRLYSPTEYIGAGTSLIPHIVDEAFADFSLLEASVDPTSAGALNGTAVVDLYEVSDNAVKLGTYFRGMQALRIPPHRFDTTLTDPADIIANNNNIYKPKLGKYYVKISPKYVESKVLATTPRVDYGDAALASITNNTPAASEYAILTPPGSFVGQRTLYFLDKTPFVSTPWTFETAPEQSGRLFGSVVEVWNSTGSILKTTKTVAENAFNFSNNKDITVALEYDAFGFEAPNQTPGVGDIIRIYPRETYFDPIFIEIDYIGVGNDILSLINFMKNDVARNLETGVFEIYDDKGITIDANHNLSGKVIQAYQISREGKYEVRRGVGVSNPNNNTNNNNQNV